MNRKRKTNSFLYILSSMLIATFIVCLCKEVLTATTVYAAETGKTYIATTQAHYVHPVTGEVADSGNNEAIGQPMTENITNSKALVEQTDSGSMYATLRLSMMDSISNVRFSTQEWGGDGWNLVSSTVMQENVGGDYTSDFRFAIPSESVVIKVEFYVTPMGRDISYFVIFTNFEEGSLDFIVSIENTGTSTVDTTQEEQDTTLESKQTQTVIPSNNLPANTTSSQNAKKDVSITTKANTSLSQTPVIKKKTATQLIEEAEGLVLSDDSLLVKDKTDENVESEEKAILETVNPLPWVLVFQCIIILTVPATVLAILLSLIIMIQRKRECD